MKIAYYVRPWSIDYFQYIANTGLSNHEASFVSDFKGLCENDLSLRFYKSYKDYNYKLKGKSIDLDMDVINDIVLRDRLLRDMDKDEGIKLLVSAYYSINEYLETHTPDAFISVTVDSYIIDLFKHLCDKKTIPFFGIHLTMIKDYTLIISRGELNNFRKVDAKELQSVYEQVSSNKYSVSYVDNKNPSFMVGFKRWFKSIMKIPYFEVVRRIRRDSLNYHYLATIAVSKHRINTRFLFSKQYFDPSWEQKLSSKSKKVYMPIQFHPECNSEYWSELQDFLPYEDAFLKVAGLLSDHYQVIIKEHPEMVGLRDTRFYSHLIKLENVILVPVGVSQERLIDEVDASVTWNSSVGIESILRNKPVVTFADPIYAIGDCYLNIKNESGMLKLINDFVQKQREVTEEDKKRVVERILSTSIYGHPDECFFDLKNTEKKQDADRVSNSLSEHIEDWRLWSEESR